MDDPVGPDGGGAEREQKDIYRDLERLHQRISRLEEAGVDQIAPRSQPQATEVNSSTATPVTAAEAMLRMNLPTYCSIALADAHESLVRRDVARQSGRESLAADLDEHITALICVTMNRVMDEIALPEDWDLSRADPAIFHNPAERLQELEVLQLAGLAPWLAEEHLSAALRAFTGDWRAMGPSQVMQALGAVEEAACATHRRLMGQREARELGQSRAAKRRRTIRRLIYGFGAATIAVANSCVTLAVPVIAPASIVVGGGAAGSLANLIED